jgi:hypothetical protein
MIKFFRHIRQHLLAENRFSKYLIYAFGEIVLVVIGILIAIQINTYVNTQNLKSDNKIFLQKMINELELNKDRMEYLISKDKKGGIISLEKAVANSQRLLKLSYEGITKDQILQLLNMKFYEGSSTLNLHTSTYEELLNTGKLYTLGSDELISAIKDYYKRLKREALYNANNNNLIFDGLDLLNSNISRIYLDYSMAPKDFSFSYYPWLEDKNSNEYKQFQLGVFKVLNAQSNNLNKMKEIQSCSDSLILIINRELKLNQ